MNYKTSNFFISDQQIIRITYTLYVIIYIHDVYLMMMISVYIMMMVVIKMIIMNHLWMVGDSIVAAPCFTSALTHTCAAWLVLVAMARARQIHRQIHSHIPLFNTSCSAEMSSCDSNGDVSFKSREVGHAYIFTFINS